MNIKRLLFTNLSLLLSSSFLSSCGEHVHTYSPIAKISSTCTKTGVKAHYHCDDCGEDFAVADDGRYISVDYDSLKTPALGHDFAGSQISYERIENTATATKKCSRSGCEEKKECSLTVTPTDTSTCLTDGKKTWIFNFPDEFGGDWLDTEIVIHSGHQYSQTQYVLSGDCSTCTATKVCSRCADKVEETANVYYIKDTDVDCANPETGHYLANFEKFDPYCTERGSIKKGEPLGHIVKGITIKKSPTKTNYISGEKLDMTGLVVNGICERGDVFTVDNSELTVEYENGDTSFKTAHDYVSISFKGFTTKISVFVIKDKNVIVGDKLIMFECGTEPDFSHIQVKYGSTTTKVLNKQGVQCDPKELICGDYSYVISSSGDSEHAAISETGTLKVMHHCNEDGICKYCHQVAYGNVFYNKDTSHFTIENAKGSMSNVLKNPTYTNLDGTAIDFDHATIGSKTPVLFKDGENGVISDVIAVTKVISSIDDLRNSVTPDYNPETGELERIDGYFIMLSDIDASGSDIFYKNTNDAISWSKHRNDYTEFGFKGTFDGRGYSIKNLRMEFNGYGGLFGVTNNATIKNFKLENTTLTGWYKYSSLAYIANSTKFENIDLNYISYPDYTDHYTNQAATHGIVVGNTIGDDCIFNNINIDCENLVIGSCYAASVSKKATFDDYTVICNKPYTLGYFTSSTFLGDEIETLLPNTLVCKEETSSDLEDIIINNKFNYTVCYGKDDGITAATPEEKAAAYFEKGTAASKNGIYVKTQRFRNSDYFDLTERNIIFGSEKTARQLGFGYSVDHLNTGDYIMIPKSNTLLIYSKGEGGYNKACLDLLDKLFEFDVLFDQYYFNPSVTGSLPNKAIEGDSSFGLRQVDGTGTLNYLNDICYGEGFYNASIFEFAGSNGYYHNSYAYLPPEVYASEHPNWFSNIAKNEDSRYTSPILGQLCYTAHGNSSEYSSMVDTAAAKLLEVVKSLEGKANNNIMFGIQDNQNICDCYACKEAKTQYGSDSAAYVLFANEIVKKVKTQTNIPFTLVLFAYYATTNPPTKGNIHTDDNVAIMYAPIRANYIRSLDDDINAEYRNMFNGWSKVSKRMFAWVYCTNFSNYLFGHNVFSSMQGTYKMLLNNNVEHVYDEDQHNIYPNQRTGFSRLKLYLRGKILRDVNVNVSDLTQKFFDNYYLEAGPYMKAFYDSWINRTETQFRQGYITGSYRDEVDKSYIWDKTELVQWVKYCNDALSAIKKYETSNNTLYKKLVERISVETIFPKWVLIRRFNGATEYGHQFKADATKLGIELLYESGAKYEGGKLDYWYNYYNIN